MKLRIWVTGANGQLGNEIRCLSSKYADYEYVFTDVAELDITSLSALNEFFQKNGKFDFLINCAAYTAVDAAETNQELAFKLNTTAVDMLVEMAAKYGFFLIQISTDYVFDGEKNRPYDEDDVPIPSSVYGETKREAEHLILYYSCTRRHHYRDKEHDIQYLIRNSNSCRSAVRYPDLRRRTGDHPEVRECQERAAEPLHSRFRHQCKAGW